MDAVGICNMALGFLGADSIAALDEANATSKEEQLCARLYPPALRAVLEARAWMFATSRVTFQPAEATGLVDFPSKYPIPATVVRVLACDDGAGTFELEWRREGGYVLTETSPTSVKAKVVLLTEDAAVFPPGFLRALATRLAADLAMPLTESKPLSVELEARYQRELAQAAYFEGQQGTSERQRMSPLAARRW